MKHMIRWIPDTSTSYVVSELAHPVVCLSCLIMMNRFRCVWSGDLFILSWAGWCCAQALRSRQQLLTLITRARGACKVVHFARCWPAPIVLAKNNQSVWKWIWAAACQDWNGALARGHQHVESTAKWSWWKRCKHGSLHYVCFSNTFSASSMSIVAPKNLFSKFWRRKKRREAKKLLRDH